MSKYKVTIERVEDKVVSSKIDKKLGMKNLKEIGSIIGDIWLRDTEPSPQTEKMPNNESLNSIIIEFSEQPIDEEAIDEQIKALISLNEKGEPEETQSEMTAQMGRIVMQELDKRMAEDAIQHQV